jgi:hypothetical protein
LHADLKANNLRLKLHQLKDYLDEQVRKKWIFAVYNIERGMETLCVTTLIILVSVMHAQL